MILFTANLLVLAPLAAVLFIGLRLNDARLDAQPNSLSRWLVYVVVHLFCGLSGCAAFF
jgi:hypothetical protein